MLRRLAILLGYTLLGCLIVILTVGLVAYGRDYTYNFKTHKLVQGGTVILESTPNNLPVTVDGKKTKKKTAYRESFNLGSHTLSLSKDGYHTWQKTISITAGRVSLLQYAVLVPNNLSAQTLASATMITNQSLSRDHRHIAYVTSGETAGVYAYDLGSSSKPVKIYTPEVATTTTGAETVLSVQWSDDASRLLVFSNQDGASVVRLMSASGTGAVNLTAQYHVDLSTLQFDGTSVRQFYWVATDGLKRLDLDSTTTPVALADSVKQIYVATGRAFYIQTAVAGDSLWSIDDRNHKQQLIAALGTNDTYSIAYVSYRGTDQLAVVPSGSEVGTLYSNIFSDTPVAQVLAHGVTGVSFSPDGQYAAFSGPTNITTYDIDQSSIFSQLVSYTFTVKNSVGLPVWFDSYHLLTNQGGRLVWSEYDGQNNVDLGSSTATLQPFASADLKSIYAYRIVSGQTQLLNLTIRP